MVGTGMRTAWTSIGGLIAGTVASVTLAGVLALHVRGVVADHQGPWQVDSVTGLAVTAVGALAAAWLAAGALLATVCVVVRAAGASWRAGERLVHRCAPQVVRKALVLAVGAGIGLGMATGASATAPEPSASLAAVDAATPEDLGWAVTTPATAAPTTPATAPSPSSTALAATSTSSPATAPSPSSTALATTSTATPAAVEQRTAAPAPRPTAVETAAATRSTTAPALPPVTVVVAAGDSLWSIAANHLPPGATDAQVAAAWPRWYEANASVIGGDPDVIQPGQVLTAPATTEGPAL